MRSGSPTRLLLLDDGVSPSLEAFAAAVGVFGHGRVELVYAYDRLSVQDLAEAFEVSVIVVDVDAVADPKDLLADIVEANVPVVVLTDGCDDSVYDHVASVGAAGYVVTGLPAREVVARVVSAA